MSDTPEHPSDLSRIFDEFLVRRQLGESPSLDEYCQRFPDLAEQLRQHVRLYDALAEAGSETDVRGNMKDLHNPVAPALNTPKSAIDFVPSEKEAQRIGRYRIERILGKGGFGLVYLTHDDQLQRLVVIKVPQRERVERPEDAQAYLTEARTVAHLDHPNIVPVYDVGSTEQFPCYIVSKLIDGIDLARRLRQARLPPDEIVKLVATVAEALHHAHKPPQSVVHRDIKPSNILLDRNGEPFVTDFGLALREQDIGKGPRCAGTPAYMSPEQAHGEGHRVDGRSDIFSLGVVSYEMLTGRLPFQGESPPELLEQISNALVRPTRQLDDTIPKELDRSVSRLWQNERRIAMPRPGTWRKTCGIGSAQQARIAARLPQTAIPSRSCRKACGLSTPRTPTSFSHCSLAPAIARDSPIAFASGRRASKRRAVAHFRSA
jgi:serine/threonine protein kinase